MPPSLRIPTGIAAVLCVAGLVLWLRSQVRYAVGRNSLKILLFGMTVRRIPFSDIRRVGTPKRDSNWLKTESWTCCWDVSHRGLVVHRLSGWRRRLLITPPHRYTFRHELRLAVQKATGTEPADDSQDEAEVAGA